MTYHPVPRPIEPPLDQPYYGASFGAAVARFVKKGFTFSGRASLSEYWYSYLAVTLATVVLFIAAYGVQASNVPALGFLMLVVLGLFVLGVIVPQLAVTVRRLHDSDLSGGMYFLSWIPGVGGIILLVMLVRPSDARGARFDLVPVQHPHHTGAYHPSPAAYGHQTGVHAAGMLPPVPVPVPVPVPAPAPPTAAPTSAVPMPAPAQAVPAVPMPAVPMQAVPVPVAGYVAPVPQVQSPVPAPTYDDLESTRIAPGRSAAEWQIVLADGRRIAVASALRLGRDPVVDPAAPGAVLVPIDDPAKSLSKTHAQLQGGAGELIVTDLHSTNGTTVRTADGAEVLLVPGSGYRVIGDAELLLGDYSIRLQRQSAL